MYASAHGHRETAQLLLVQDPAVNAQDMVSCWPESICDLHSVSQPFVCEFVYICMCCPSVKVCVV